MSIPEVNPAPLPFELQLNDDVIEADDRLVAAYPKTGRTWLRFMLAHYMIDLMDVPQAVDFKNVYSIIPNTESGQVPGQPQFAYEAEISRIVFTHETPNPAKSYPEAITYITRDPRDVLVSNWFHRTRQLGQYEGSLQDFIRDAQWGVRSFASHVDAWVSTVGVNRVVRYETMKRDAATVLLGICRLLEIPDDMDRAQRAAEAASFERMRLIELRHHIVGHQYDATDPNARRVRAGKVGGFREHMSADDLQYIAATIAAHDGWARKIFDLS